MSLQEATKYDQVNYDKEVNLNENYLITKQTKMLLPNDKRCFTSFHGKIFEHRDHLSEDCSRSFDMLIFKKRKPNVINLNHNLITLNNSLFINDPLNDSLQWCLEPGYQNDQKSLFDNELSNDLYANSSFDSKVDENTQASVDDSSTRFNFHSNQNYELLSKRLDANLAEMDIETFNNYSNLLNDINTKFSSTEEVIDGANEQLIDHCSVNDSFISELNERSNSSRYEINGIRLKPALNSSFTFNSNSNQTDDHNDDTMHETINMESVGISVDSLDNSCFEQKCAEVVNKCKKTDKSKYTLAFDGQMDDSTNESLLNYEQYLTRIKRNEIHLNKMFDDLHRRLSRDRLTIDKLSRSEYSTNSGGDEQSVINQSSQINDLNASKLTKSLQSDLIHHSLKQKSFDRNEYIPLFNLNNSFNSESSSVSAPKSLIKLFIQNKNSPSSSGGGLGSGQLSGSLEESSELASSKTNRLIGNESVDKRCANKQANTTHRTTNRTIEVQTCEPMNQNNHQANSTETHLSGMLYGGYRNVADNSVTVGGSLTNTNLTNLKMYHNRKTSPIREEDEHESTTKEVKKYTTFQNVTAMCRNQQNKIDASLQVNDSKSERSNCPRSISMNEFNSRKQNLIKQYSLKGGQSTEQPTQHLQQQQQNSVNRPSRTNRKECSISSGYLSSGGSNNMFVENNRKQFQQRMFNQTSCEDKQIQTSIHVHSAGQPILINELPSSNNCCSTSNNAPIYVYYPNYSLPDLNFVQMGSFQKVHLSPTKLQPVDCNSKIKRPSGFGARMQSRVKSRPKSTGDFEKLTKESLNHIQDWESLKTLLPDDIKELISRLNLDEDDECRVKSKTTSNTPTSNKTFQMSIQNSAATIKLRPKVTSRGSKDKNADQYNSTNDQNNKRLSLQEPIHLDDCVLNCSSANTHSEASCCSSHHQSRRGMIKSATMNMPIIMQQQHRQMQSRMLYQTPCHSCCSINQLNMCHQVASCHCSRSNSHCSLNNIHCNNHYSMNHNQFNNCPSTCCAPNYSTTPEQQYYQQQFISPMKPCNPISEQTGEQYFESLNCLLENENENGELDFDRLLNCQQTSKLENKVNRNVLRTKADCFEESRNRKGNFNDLKNHWEKVASSASSKQTTPTTPTVKKSIASNQPSQAQQTSNTKQKIQPQPIKPRPTTGRYARGQVKAKVNSRRSRSKSPEKSNKEVIILTNKTVKPHVPSRQVLRPGNSNTITRATRQQTSAAKKPIRPSSFNTQFKSMIPIAKNSNRSPPTK